MSVTINEMRSSGFVWVERTYTDDEIRELFDDDANTLVIALLNRAQAAEKKLKQQERWE